MSKPLRNRVLTVSLKKAFIRLLIACVVFTVCTGIALYLNFGDRVSQTRDAAAQNQQQITENSVTTDISGSGHAASWKGISSKRWKLSGSWFTLKQELNLTAGDKVMIGVIAGIAAALGAGYWLLCVIWAYQKSVRLGSNSAFWIIAALILNLWAIAALYIYAGFRSKCSKCGQLKHRGEKYCSHCGNAWEIQCESCHTDVPADAAFCPNCGKPINKSDAENEQNSPDCADDKA